MTPDEITKAIQALRTSVAEGNRPNAPQVTQVCDELERRIEAERIAVHDDPRAMDNQQSAEQEKSMEQKFKLTIDLTFDSGVEVDSVRLKQRMQLHIDEVLDAEDVVDSTMRIRKIDEDAPKINPLTARQLIGSLQSLPDSALDRQVTVILWEESTNVGVAEGMPDYDGNIWPVIHTVGEPALIEDI